MTINTSKNSHKSMRIQDSPFSPLKPPLFSNLMTLNNYHSLLIVNFCHKLVTRKNGYNSKKIQNFQFFPPKSCFFFISLHLVTAIYNYKFVKKKNCNHFFKILKTPFFLEKNAWLL